MRTQTNDNDKAKKYFGDPASILRQKNDVLRGYEEEEGNALVEKLKAQTETNKEKNRLAVERRTFENDQVREGLVPFRPISRSLHVACMPIAFTQCPSHQPTKQRRAYIPPKISVCDFWTV